MEHKRITVEEAQAAYETTGIKPLVKMYFSADYHGEGEHCGCPAFVVAVARSGKTLEELRSDGGFNSRDLVDNTFNESYLMGFVSAVDGRGNHDRWVGDPDLCNQGREDGLAVRAALWPEPASAH